VTESIDEPNQLIELTETECLELLADHAFGRLAFGTPDGVKILPVNYAFVDKSIVIRTAIGSKLQHAPMTKVAFEIDEVSSDHVSGWSVVARGTALDISSSIDEYSEHLRALPAQSWIAGTRSHVVKIAVNEVTGRRFSSSA
jgi:nitroimidazol reductase NimA-like FMN-containing flavoprotein (pyridoxamine 5'-phosphate oxidase superfamily)